LILKNFGGNGCSLIKASVQVLSETTEENHENVSAWPVSQPNPEQKAGR
jgi:hypothetical protein